MTCKNCGSEINGRFCSVCGFDAEGPASSQSNSAKNKSLPFTFIDGTAKPNFLNSFISLFGNFMWYEIGIAVCYPALALLYFIDSVRGMVAQIDYFYSPLDFCALLFASIVPPSLLLAFSVMTIVFLVKRNRFLKDVILFAAFERILSSALLGVLSLRYIKVNSISIFESLAYAFTIVVLLTAFIERLRTNAFVKYIVWGGAALSTLFFFVSTLAMHTGTVGIISSLSFAASNSLSLFIAFYSIHNDDKPIMSKQYKPFGVDYSSVYFTLIPGAVIIIAGLAVIIVGSGFISSFDSLILSLLPLYIEIFFIVSMCLFGKKPKIRTRAEIQLESTEKFVPQTQASAVSSSDAVTVTAPEYNRDAVVIPSDFGISMVNFILLMLFTFGIYPLIWIYKTTERLNVLPDEPYRSPAKKLLLCMFIPFYSFYWFYKSAQIIDKICIKIGWQSDFSSFFVLLMFFMPLAAPALIQSKITDIALNAARKN